MENFIEKIKDDFEKQRNDKRFIQAKEVKLLDSKIDEKQAILKATEYNMNRRIEDEESKERIDELRMYVVNLRKHVKILKSNRKDLKVKHLAEIEKIAMLEAETLAAEEKRLEYEKMAHGGI